jgi:hypothetical protein
MTFSDSFSDRHILSTDNNEYADGLNDENEWEENILDSEIPLDDDISDWYDDPEDSREEYNETGFDRRRID